MKLYNLDQHCSVNSDLKQIFEGLGHTLDIDSMSGHSHIMGRPQISVPWLRPEAIITEHLWDRFYDEYAGRLEGYDAFVCCYPPIFALLYKRFNKPVILDIPIRYEFPHHEQDADGKPFGSWHHFNELLDEMPLNIYIANNRLDQAYFEQHTGAQCQYIPSLCDYTGMQYNPVRPEVLMYDSSRAFSRNLAQCVNRYDPCMQGHKWSDVAGFRAIAHIPYQVSTMSFFEQHSAGIPLFYPSKEYLLELYKGGADVLREVFWTRDIKGKFTWENMAATLELADYYQPEFHVEYFHSVGDLDCLVDDDSVIEEAAMTTRFKARLLRERVPGMWKQVLERVKA